jgi:hypothetical protein
MGLSEVLSQLSLSEIHASALKTSSPTVSICRSLRRSTILIGHVSERLLPPLMSSLRGAPPFQLCWLYFRSIAKSWLVDRKTSAPGICHRSRSSDLSKKVFEKQGNLAH